MSASFMTAHDSRGPDVRYSPYETVPIPHFDAERGAFRRRSHQSPAHAAGGNDSPAGGRTLFMAAAWAANAEESRAHHPRGDGPGGRARNVHADDPACGIMERIRSLEQVRS